MADIFPMETHGKQGDKGDTLILELTSALRETRDELNSLRKDRENASKHGWVAILVPIAFALAIAAHAFLWNLNARVLRMETASPQTLQQMQTDILDHEERLRELEHVHRTDGGGIITS